MSAQKATEQKAATTSAAKKVKKLSAKDVGFSAENKKIAAPESFSIAIRECLQNWRQGTVSCKGRGDVARANRKPWKQKGTGRARAGSARSPLWRGGGVTFGPQKRTRKLSVSKGMKKNVAQSLVWDFVDNGALVQIDWTLNHDTPKTSVAYSMLRDAGLEKTQVNLFLSPNDVITAASFTNIPSVRVVFFDAPNIYELADSSHWVVLKKDVELFKGMVARWI